MPAKDQLTMPQSELVERWQHELKHHLKDGDEAEVRPDHAHPNGLRVTIRSAGRQQYEFDFDIRYLDSREIDIGLVDVERDDEHVNEGSFIIQQLIAEYRRHLHECAQALQAYTHA
jgi:hypothetical protein